MDSFHEMIGYAAALCTTGCLLPQVARAWRTRSTEDISRRMFMVMALGNALWLTYGIMGGSPSIIAANATAFCLAALILFLKFRHG